jgi:hypothetical protein
MRIPFLLRSVPEAVRTLAEHAVEQDAPVVVAAGKTPLGDAEHTIRHRENRSNLHIGLLFHARRLLYRMNEFA